MEFLAKGIQDTNVRAYYDFMVDAAVMFGANRMAAEHELLDSLNFEIELAKVFQHFHFICHHLEAFQCLLILLDCRTRR